MKKHLAIFLINKFSLFSLFILTFLVMEVISQDKSIIRRVSLNRQDTLILASIMTGEKLKKIYTDGFYFWYSSGSIQVNQGGFTGNLLHGEYIELDSRGMMIQKGEFQFGLKKGYWYFWYPDGSIKEITRWELGRQNGASIQYSPSGEIVMEGKYRKGKRKGFLYAFENNTPFRAYYRKGKEIYRKSLINREVKSDNES